VVALAVVAVVLAVVVVALAVVDVALAVVVVAPVEVVVVASWKGAPLSWMAGIIPQISAGEAHVMDPLPKFEFVSTAPAAEQVPISTVGVVLETLVSPTFTL
jgi:hypothetical protein